MWSGPAAPAEGGKRGGGDTGSCSFVATGAEQDRRTGGSYLVSRVVDSLAVGRDGIRPQAGVRLIARVAQSPSSGRQGGWGGAETSA